MEITANEVKELRQTTGAGIMDCKEALKEAGGDKEKAIQLLRKKGIAKEQKRAERTAAEGVIEAYIHANKKIGVILEVNCETDFVARNSEFQQFVHDVAMQIAALSPKYISEKDIPQEIIEQESEFYRQEPVTKGKPPEIVEKIVGGKLKKFYEQVCLLYQPFIKDESMTIESFKSSISAKLGENIVIRRFCRFQLGEES